MRNVPIDLIRFLLVLLGVFFGYFLGRSIVQLQERRIPRSKTITWALRTIVALLGLTWGPRFDTLAIAGIVLALAAVGGGYYVDSRPRGPDEETRLHLE